LLAPRYSSPSSEKGARPWRGNEMAANLNGNGSSRTVVSRHVPNRDRVLLIEDDRDSLAATFLTLSHAGYSVLTADDGAQAVDLLSKGIHPRLIVLDLVLPKVNGWMVLKHLQTDKALREIPVIVVTAWKYEGPPIKGADVILEKPLDAERLVTEMARILGDGAAA